MSNAQRGELDMISRIMAGGTYMARNVKLEENINNSENQTTLNVKLEENINNFENQPTPNVKLEENTNNSENQPTPNVKLEENTNNSEDQPINSTSENNYYVEERAWREFNPEVPNDIEDSNSFWQTMTALPPAPPLDLNFPNTQYCKWSFDPEHRVLNADFTPKSQQEVVVSPEDKAYLLKMMERDDVTVISDGLLPSLDPELWCEKFIDGSIGDIVYHHFRLFVRYSNDDGSEVIYDESPGWVSMHITDYLAYLKKRNQVLKNIRKRRMDAGLDPFSTDDYDKHRRLDEEVFEFEVSGNAEESLNVVNDVLYMIDLDIVKYLPHLMDDFCKNFKLKEELMPGGKHCMMNSVNVNGRPFMGPNLYLTPPCTYTHFHQDGHGTVDSGHVCLSGYNEVVILRRLTETRKKHALFLLYGDRNLLGYDALYGRPHGDENIKRPDWPTLKAIQKCQKMNYYPSYFILKPGQHVHLNKGRLHAFRKLSPDKLNTMDCHYELRQKTMKEENLGTDEHICMSVAWDWLYTGVSASGISKEIASTLECARLNRINTRQSLAIPETCLIQHAKHLVSEFHTLSNQEDNNSNSSNASASIIGFTNNCKIPEKETSELSFIRSTLMGLLPSLQYVVARHVDAYCTVDESSSDKTNRVSISQIPDSCVKLCPIDPFGAGDFFCKLCSVELSNIYMHCDGCERILNKDFNICIDCHRGGKHKVFVQMHPLNDRKALSAINHAGHFTRDRARNCPCKMGPVCKACGFCSGCSCKCHQAFTLHYRFMDSNSELKLLANVSRIVGEDLGDFFDETFNRLMEGQDFDVKRWQIKMIEFDPQVAAQLCIFVPESELGKARMNAEGTVDENFQDTACLPVSSKKKKKKKRNSGDISDINDFLTRRRSGRTRTKRESFGEFVDSSMINFSEVEQPGKKRNSKPSKKKKENASTPVEMMDIDNSNGGHTGTKVKVPSLSPFE